MLCYKIQESKPSTRVARIRHLNGMIDAPQAAQLRISTWYAETISFRLELGVPYIIRSKDAMKMQLVTIMNAIAVVLVFK